MAHIVSGELREDAKKFTGQNSNGQWAGYEVRLSEMVKDRKTGEKTYTNYRAVFFASTEKMSDYLSGVLVQGRSLSISCSKLKVDIFTKQDGSQSVNLIMEEPRIDWSSFSVNNNANATPNNNSGNQGGWGAPQQPSSPPQSKPQPSSQDDEEIPF